MPWFYYAMLGNTPLWLGYLIVSVVLAYTATIVGVIVGKAGYSPFWGFLALSPALAVIMLARIAWGKWRQRPQI
jgi:hypothetical protein